MANKENERKEFFKGIKINRPLVGTAATVTAVTLASTLGNTASELPKKTSNDTESSINEVNLESKRMNEEYWEKTSIEDLIKDYREAVIEKIAQTAGVQEEDITIFPSDKKKSPEGGFTWENSEFVYVAPALSDWEVEAFQNGVAKEKELKSVPPAVIIPVELFYHVETRDGWNLQTDEDIKKALQEGYQEMDEYIWTFDPVNGEIVVAGLPEHLMTQSNQKIDEVEDER